MVTRDDGDISLNFDNRICSKPAWVVWSWAVLTVCNVWGRFYVVKKLGLIKVVRSGSFHMIGWRNGGLAFGVRGGE